jgi:hypothetical protein
MKPETNLENNGDVVSLRSIIDQSKTAIVAATDKELTRMSAAINKLVRRRIGEIQNRKGVYRRTKTKFDPLFQYFRLQTAGAITLTFAEIAGIIGHPLCETAYKVPAYWRRSVRGGYSRISDCWVANGYVIAELSLENQRVKFARTAVTVLANG